MNIRNAKLLGTNFPWAKMLVLVVFLAIAAMLTESFVSIRVPGIEVVVDATSEQKRLVDYEDHILERLEDVESRLRWHEGVVAERNTNVGPRMDAKPLEAQADSEFERLMELWRRCLSNSRKVPMDTDSKRRWRTHGEFLKTVLLMHCNLNILYPQGTDARLPVGSGTSSR